MPASLPECWPTCSASELGVQRPGAYWPTLLCLTEALARHTLQSRGVRQRLNDMTKARTNRVRNVELMNRSFFQLKGLTKNPTFH
jgi:hypothetical protein